MKVEHMKGYSCELWMDGSHWKTVRMESLKPSIYMALLNGLNVFEPERPLDKVQTNTLEFRLRERLSENRAKYEFERLS